MFEIAILNPRPKSAKKRRARKSRSRSKGVAKMAKRRRKLTAKQIAAGFGGKRRKARKHRVRRRKHVAKVKRVVRRHRRRARKSGGKKHYVSGGYTVGNARIRRYKMNPRRRRHRNPISVKGITGQLIPAAYGAAGGIALDVAMGYVTPMLPAMLTTGYVKHATRIAGALGIGWASKKFLGGKGDAVAKGALVIAMYGLLKDVIVQFAPGVKGLSGYEEVTVNTGDLGAYLNGPSLAAYLPDGSTAPGVGAYMDAAATLNGADY